MLLGQYHRDQPEHGGPIREDAHHVTAQFHLLVQPFGGGAFFDAGVLLGGLGALYIWSTIAEYGYQGITIHYTFSWFWAPWDYWASSPWEHLYDVGSAGGGY